VRWKNYGFRTAINAESVAIINTASSRDRSSRPVWAGKSA
jgi:hypothetical protein